MRFYFFTDGTLSSTLQQRRGSEEKEAHKRCVEERNEIGYESVRCSFMLNSIRAAAVSNFFSNIAYGALTGKTLKNACDATL